MFIILSVKRRFSVSFFLWDRQRLSFLYWRPLSFWHWWFLWKPILFFLLSIFHRSRLFDYRLFWNVSSVSPQAFNCDPRIWVSKRFLFVCQNWKSEHLTRHLQWPLPAFLLFSKVWVKSWLRAYLFDSHPQVRDPFYVAASLHYNSLSEHFCSSDSFRCEC